MAKGVTFKVNIYKVNAELKNFARFIVRMDDADNSPLKDKAWQEESFDYNLYEIFRDISNGKKAQYTAAERQVMNDYIVKNYRVLKKYFYSRSLRESVLFNINTNKTPK